MERWKDGQSGASASKCPNVGRSFELKSPIWVNYLPILNTWLFPFSWMNLYFKSLVKFLVQDIIVLGFIYFAPWILQQIPTDFLIWPFEIESPDARLALLSLAPADNRTAHSCNFTIVSLLVNNKKPCTSSDSLLFRDFWEVQETRPNMSFLWGSPFWYNGVITRPIWSYYEVDMRLLWGQTCSPFSSPSSPSPSFKWAAPETPQKATGHLKTANLTVQCFVKETGEKFYSWRTQLF